MRSSARLFVPSVLVLVAGILGVTAHAQQAPIYPVGRTPTPEEIRKWDIAIGPSGKELPPGSGTAKEGAEIFAKKCALCHGRAGEGTQLGPQLITAKGKPPTIMEWPFDTPIWDFINRAMPIGQEGSLSASDVYALTAFLLARNGVIQEGDEMDAKTLPKVHMPNRKGFTPPPKDWKPGTPRPFTSDP